jgi:anti-sigma factor RsiW
MAEITRLHGSDHEQTQRLLPWYNNGTLDADEAAMVQAHLAECAECRADAAEDEALARHVAGLPLDVEHGWGLLDEQATQEPQPKTSNVAIFRRRVPVSWMLAGQAAAAVLVVGIFTALPSRAPEPTYHALSSAPAAVSGNMVVMFKPDTSEERMRAALLGAGAQVVNGPNVSGAYVLLVPQQSRDAALQQLRGMPQVALAEPIGDGTAS